MSDAGLRFDLTLARGDFALAAAAEIPLTGITALSGPSGSGKTTLLRAIAGLEPSAQGHIHFASQDWHRVPAARRGIGYVFQDAKLFPHLTVQGNLDYGATRRNATAELVAAVIEALDLRPLLDRMPETLSGGESRRVAIGRALASAPRILLMDEPLSGLDRARKADLMPYIARAVAGFGVPAIYVTHSANEIGFLADRTLEIDEGRLIGWRGAAPRLIGQVVNTAPGQVQLALGDHRIWFPGQGYMDETWAVPLGQDFTVTQHDPGATNAALGFNARVVEARPGSGLLRFEFAGQHVTIPWAPAEGAVPMVNASIWVLLPRLSARPVQVA